MCKHWPLLLTCIQPCDPPASPRRAGAGVRFYGGWPLRCGGLWSPPRGCDTLPCMIPPAPLLIPLAPFSMCSSHTGPQPVKASSSRSASGLSCEPVCLLGRLLFLLFLSRPAFRRILLAVSFPREVLSDCYNLNYTSFSLIFSRGPWDVF